MRAQVSLSHEGGNETLTADFILSGLFPNMKYVSILIYTTILIYLAAVAGNLILLLLIWVDPRLHTPMYFLLSQLSLVDLALISSTVPKMVMNFFSGRKNITRLACGTQIFFFFTFGGAECILLTLMAYDRYVAVCNPLRYAVIMNHRVCLQMAILSWIAGILASTAHTSYTMNLPICRSREIHHFFCEMPAIMKISCKDTSTYELVVFVMGVAFIIIPFGLIMASYTFIFLTVVCMKPLQGRNKALATCSSHLTVVSFYLGPCVYMYMMPGSSHSPEQEQAVSVFCTVLTPMLNPLIYSLRNKDVVGAFQKVLRKRPVSKQNTKISQ
ncbi:PREDICTED: olfactory receptor 2T11-like [Ceratotherium simum simum]|uniref:Olfactory receptor n=1 Tax=Ceratotherium simum simum TaxID=73337 RepID=A0ABM1DDG0_CERSS|nr:PREDICTED: olfactory receptor 2T11-like [Ceratotherium simum simum]